MVIACAVLILVKIFSVGYYEGAFLALLQSVEEILTSISVYWNLE